MRAIILTSTMQQTSSTVPIDTLKRDIVAWCADLGFQQTGVSDIDLAQAEGRLNDWLRQKFHGSMSYMERHGTKRSHPEQLVPGTVSRPVRTDGLPDG